MPRIVKRTLWSVLLAYGLASGLYAAAMLVALLGSAVERAWSLAIPLMVSHILLFPIVREGWTNLPGRMWVGLLSTSEATQFYARTVIRTTGAILLLSLILFAVYVYVLNGRLPDGANSRLPGLVIAGFLLFVSIVYMACSLLGGAAVRSPGLSLWERLLRRLGRRLPKG